MTTLQDVARRAGVSTATVSKVLSNTPYFTEETRQKVIEAVKALGYVPNLAARALSSGKTHIITVVFPYIYDGIFKDPLVMQIIEGIEAVCSGEGYNLLLSTPRLSEAGPDENFRQLIGSGYIDGLIAIDNVPLASVASVARARGIPSVVIGYHESPYVVRSDERSGGEKLMDHLLSLGHRRIGIITVAEDINFAVNERCEGLRVAAERGGLDYKSLPIAYGDYSVNSGIVAAATLLEAHPDLTALICLNDRMALGAMEQIRDMGQSVPDDISIVGYDNITIARLASPSLTTIDQHAMDLGTHAARMLFDILNNVMPSPVVLPVELMIRASTAVPRL